MSFRFRPALTALFVPALIVLLMLGSWQVRRLAWKEDLIARVEARVDAPPIPLDEALSRGEDVEYLPVRVLGGFPTAKVAHVFGTHEGTAGWYVFQPFQPDGSGSVLLINRGFVPDDARRETYELPNVDAFTGLVRTFESGDGLAGLVNVPADPATGSYFSREAEPLYDAFGVPAEERLTIYLDSTLPTELPRGGTTRLDFSNRHLGYVITWFGLAAGLVAVFLAMSRVPARRHDG